MLVVGTAVGGVIAFVIFAVSVVSLPMLLERGHATWHVYRKAIVPPADAA